LEAELIPNDLLDLLCGDIIPQAFSFTGEVATFMMLRLYLLVGLLATEF